MMGRQNNENEISLKNSRTESSKIKHNKYFPFSMNIIRKSRRPIADELSVQCKRCQHTETVTYELK